MRREYVEVETNNVFNLPIATRDCFRIINFSYAEIKWIDEHGYHIIPGYTSKQDDIFKESVEKYYDCKLGDKNPPFMCCDPIRRIPGFEDGLRHVSRMYNKRIMKKLLFELSYLSNLIVFDVRMLLEIVATTDIKLPQFAWGLVSQTEEGEPNYMMFHTIRYLCPPPKEERKIMAT